MVDRRAGIVDDEHLHIRQVRGTREVAAAFLLDMSSSTSTPVSPPEPSHEPDPEPDTILYRGSPWDEDEPPPPTGPTVLDVAKESLAVICDALQILGDEHAIYGFSGSGRDGVELYVAKDFAEAPSARTWARLAAMQPRSYTRMGPAIRHATARLKRRGGAHPVPRRRVRRLSAGPRLRPEPRRRDLRRGRHGQGAGGGRTPRHRHVLHHRRPRRARLPAGDVPGRALRGDRRRRRPCPRSCPSCTGPSTSTSPRPGGDGGVDGSPERARWTG